MDDQQLQQLIAQLQNGNDQQRRAASYKLGKSKSESAVAALINAFNDKDSSVRQNVIDGLRAIATPEALEFLNSQTLKTIQTTATTKPVEKSIIYMDDNQVKTQVQEFFAQEWRKRSFVVFLNENDFAKKYEPGEQFKWFDWTMKQENSSVQGAEFAVRGGLAYLTLGLSELAILGARGASFAAKKAQQPSYKKDVNISFLSERHLEAALLLGLLREPEGSFALKTVYVGHPYSKSIYSSVAHFHELLFKEKAREIVRICSAMGASRLKVTYMREDIRSKGGKASIGIPVEMPMAIGASFESTSSKLQEIWHEATYVPSRKPSLPPQNELIWYETEPQWKQLVDDRLNYGLLTINLQIQSRQDYQVNGQLAADVQSMGLSLGGEWIEHTKLLLTVDGEFVPLQYFS